MGDADVHGWGVGSDFARGRPVLEGMGKNIVHAGEAGAGQAAKVCNNLMLGISMLGVSEAFALAAKLGLPAQGFVRYQQHVFGAVLGL